MRILSKNSTANTTSTPAMAPMIAAEVTETNAQGAVTATSPAKQPLRIMLRSGFLSSSQAATAALKVAVTAALLTATPCCPGKGNAAT